MSGSALSDPLRCGDVAYDARQRTLVVRGKRTLLDGRSALVFQALAEQFGEIVSKDALLEAAWPGRLVHENSLAKAISRLRGALCGSGLTINAAYGFGYSLALASDKASIDVSADQEALPADRKAKLPTPRKVALVALLALILSAAVAFVLLKQADPMDNASDAAFKTHDAPDALAVILWVDDHPSNNRQEVAYLKGRRIAVHTAETTEDALKLLRMNDYRLVLSDLGRGDDRLAGLKLAALMKQQGMDEPVIIYTVRPKEAAGQQAQRAMVREAGADLAVTPAEVQAMVVDRLAAMLDRRPA